MKFQVGIATFAASFTVIVALFSSGCSTGGCVIAPPKEIHTNLEKIQKISADLTAFTKAPVTLTFENGLKDKTDYIFQELNDENTACYMLLSTASCINSQPNGQELASRLINYLMNGKQCEKEATNKQVKEFSEINTGDWIGISYQIDNKNLPATRPLDLSKAPHTITTDVVHLTFNNGIVSGTTEGQRFTWENTGYLRDGTLVLAYRTAGPTGRGFGTYHLVDQEGLGDVYVGYMEGRECVIEQIVKYPYILVRGKPGSREVDSAKQKYSSMLSQHGVLVNPLVCSK